MNIGEFWTIVDAAAKKARGNPERFTDALIKALSKLEPEEIVAFESEFRTRRNEACTWGLWGAAYVISGGCGDDGFDYFRGWLIAQGREVFERAIKDPESLADLRIKDPEGLEMEDVLYAASEAYAEAADGDEMPESDVDLLDEPTGERWEEEDLERLYPRLWKKYAEDGWAS